MRKEFGKTWWGKKWVDTIEMMDYNRLQRGKRYARNDYVSTINIDKNRVIAKVRGSSYNIYDVKLKFNPFTKKAQASIINFIKENPLILAKLLKGEFPKEIYDFTEKNKIEVFPTTWEHLSPKCSCPDWAVPCKHLAAVMYIIGDEIDKNPFIVFTLHDFDLLSEISKLGFEVETDNRTNIKKLGSNYSPLEAELENEKIEMNSIVDEIDFSIIDDISGNILRLLTDNPDFYDRKNFKELITQFYKDIKKYNEKLIKTEIIEEKHFQKLEDFIILYNMEKNETEFFIDKKNTFKPTKNFNKIINLAESMPLEILMENAPKYAQLILVKEFCQAVLKNGGIVPEIMSVKDEGYIVEWKPALIDENIKNIFEKLSEIMSNDIFALKAKKPNKDSITDRKISYIPIEAEARLAALTKFFIGENLREVVGISKATNTISSEDKVMAMFFANKTFVAKGFGEDTLPHRINIWLSKLHFINMKTLPIIRATEIDENIEVDVVFEIKEGDLIKKIEVNEILNETKYEKIKFEALKCISIIGEYFPELEQLVLPSGRNKIIKTIEEFATVIFDIVPLIKLMGLKVMLPKGMQELVSPKLSLTAKSSSDKPVKTYLTLSKMLDFNYKIALGDEFVNVDEFLKLVSNRKGLVKIKDSYFYINSDFIKKLKNLDDEPKITANDKLKAIISEEYNDSPIEISAEVKKMIRELMETKSIEKPANLLANLREYQQRGYEWLYKNSKTGFGSLIADDMGLGKTLQVITLITRLKEEGELDKKKALIIVPTTLLTNWKKEIEKFSPGLKSFIYHGSSRKLDVKNCDIVLTSYGIARSDVEILSKAKWSILAIDEAQNIKNPETNQTKATKKIKADVKIAMTGTPVENRLIEYWSIFDFLNKGYLGNMKKFKEEIAIPIEAYRDKGALDRFKKITSPFIIRREKSDRNIIKDLPDKIETDRFCSLVKEQAALYESVVEDMMEKIDSNEGIERKGMVFKLMTSLKQICNHPANFLKDDNTTIDSSGKLKSLMELLEEIYESNEKVLIFTQYKEMGDILVKEITKKIDTPMFLHGGVTRKKRDDMVENFQNNPQEKIFILSLKAGGTGLNLTKASNVVHYDLWWNPAVEAQATDRAYRIGQKNNVNVHRFITQGTFEEKINEMIQRKKELAELTVSTGENWIGNLSTNELKDLVKLG